MILRNRIFARVMSGFVVREEVRLQAEMLPPALQAKVALLTRLPPASDKKNCYVALLLRLQTVTSLTC